MLTLYVGSKNYSSWSLRPWLLLKHAQIPFKEISVDIAGRGATDLHRSYSDNGLVPCLHDGDFRIWDTLAIAEYLAESHPSLWPADKQLRARARSVCAEMHSGFAALRIAMGMNISRRAKGLNPLPDDLQDDIDRIVAIWQDAQIQARGKGRNGDYLFGDFSIADAMFAPVVWRFYTYNVQLPEPAMHYCQTMQNHSAMQQWKEQALMETKRIAKYDAIIETFGGAMS